MPISIVILNHVQRPLIKKSQRRSFCFVRTLARCSGRRAAMDYKPVVVQRHPRPVPAKHNAESRYWRQFKHPVFIKEYAPVTSIHFSPSKPHRYAVTAATRVQIYAPRTQKITKTISRFKDVARSGCIRGDGKLVVAGDDSGLIQVSTESGFFSMYLYKNQIL